jgi:signal transduction histidine kinase
MDALATVGADGTVRELNAAAIRLVESIGADPVRMQVLDLLEPGAREAARRVLAVAGAGRRVGPFRVVLPVAGAPGSRLELAVLLAPAPGTGQGRRGVTIVARDITRTRRLIRQGAALREELARAHRSAVLGRLVESVAHDLGNVLSAIHGYATIVATDLSGPLLDDQMEIIRAADRGTELTRTLLARTRPRAAGHVDVAVDDIVGSCARMLRRLLPPRVELVLRLTSDAIVALDPMELDQVLMNLVLNARDAIGATGRITVETTRVVGPGVEADAGGAGDVLLCVTDTGHGMDRATRERMYEPYFTTKAHMAGTGLGLATVREIVDRSGGSIEVRTAPGAGTSFQIRLTAIR